MATTRATPDPDTIAVHLSFVQDVLADERERGKALDSKSGSLAGFAGVVLSLTLTFGRPVLEKPLGSVGNILMAAFFILSVVALASGALVAIAGNLRPQKHLAVTNATLRALAQLDALTVPKEQAEGRLLATLAHHADPDGESVIERERRVNDRKIVSNNWSVGCLAVGYVGVAAQALLLAARDLGL